MFILILSINTQVWASRNRHYEKTVKFFHLTPTKMIKWLIVLTAYLEVFLDGITVRTWSKKLTTLSIRKSKPIKNLSLITDGLGKLLHQLKVK